MFGLALIFLPLWVIFLQLWAARCGVDRFRLPMAGPGRRFNDGLQVVFGASGFCHGCLVPFPGWGVTLGPFALSAACDSLDGDITVVEVCPWVS